jgi:hypothetical protein
MANEIGDLIRQLRDELSLLLRQEVALAKTEMTEKATRVGRNVGYLAAGALLGLAGLVVLLFALSAGLEVLLFGAGMGATAHWLAPLLVGVLVIVVSLVLVTKAMATLKEESLIPEKTVQSLEEDKEWLQRKTV